jgi:alpha-beta hydrolase superfamily lysophospholipase
MQERLIFFPEKLPKNFRFKFYNDFEEINIKSRDGLLLNAVLFKAINPKGVIFYLHGNAGSINSWGEVASVYTNLNYDVFMPDYRGYGKSEGSISSEAQFFGDMQMAYDSLKSRYDESKIIVLGYSIGTGVAARLASTNQPAMLILQAPFYSLTDLSKHLYPIIPAFVVKYKFRTYKYIQDCTMPIILFHGDRDEIIYSGSASKLKPLMKRTDRVIILKDVGHNGMSSNKQYLIELQKILAN